MISFTLKIKNRPAEANIWFAEYPGYFQYVREGDFSPIEVTDVVESGTLIVTVASTITGFRDEIVVTDIFEDGATYICDFAVKQIYKETVIPTAGIPILGWLLGGIGIAVVIAIAVSRKKK